VVSAVAEVPRGSHPSYALGYYARDNAFYEDWDATSRDRDAFSAWMTRHVVETKDFAQYLVSLEESRA
jgi:glutaconate CoA-transferase subunit A